MNCKGCAHENPAGAKFCEECGTPLGIACANCGSELRATVKFCSECGAPVAAGGAGSSPAPSSQSAPAAMPASPAVGTRKIVTIVFADLAGSTAMQERLDPESVRRFMESYYDAMREAVESHGGTVTQFLGDGVKAVFGIPRVSEDDAIRAVRAGVAMQKSFRALAENQRGAVGAVGLRVAVNTGEVVANADDEIIGDPVNVAARLQEQGGNGDVVVGDSTARLVEALVTLAPLGSFTLKGRAEAVAAFVVESLDPPASAATAAFVGRDEELIRLTLVYEGAIEKPATSLAILLGSPGLGKSRLIDEFSRRLGDAAQVVEAHCDQANGATFAPLAIALRGLLGIEAGASGDAPREATLAAIPEDDRDRERIANGIAALLAGSPGSIEETFFVVRRLFASLASVRPLVLVIDDLQWAEPLLLDLVEHLVQWGSGVRMLVLVGARPELRDKRVSLTIPGGLVSDVVTLSGLDAGAAMRLAANVIGAESLPAAVAAKVLATSEGNPLFVGELVRMLVHEGALKREGDRWTTGTALAALAIPPTIHALLAARIERLQPAERVILERASIVGRHFSRSAVVELLPPGISNLDAHLETLRRSELIERDTGWFFGEPVLRFHHVLIRDAAYRQLLKGTRAELHTRFADWAFEQAEGSAEHDETIGWHLEQAHQFLRELGPIDANGRVTGERASKHLAAAGTRALAGDDVSLAGSLLGRAIERLDPDDGARAELALDWCEALLASGDVGPAMRAIDELDRFVGDSERLRAWHTCFAGQHTVLTAPEGLQSTADIVAGAADKLASLDDAAGEAKAHYVYALALSSLGKIGACEAALDRALAAARRVAGDRRRANTVLAIAPLAALSGPSPVTRASGRCLDVVRVLRITQGAPAVEAVALSCQGVLEALRGRTDAARRMISSARTMVEELGITQRLLEVDVFSGQVDLLEGEAVAAEGTLRRAYDGLRELGLDIDAAKAAALLARALLAQDRDAEAETLSHESEALAGDDLKAAIAWRGVRAEALARRGEHADAVKFASAAVEIAAATDALLDHADARLALAAALRAAGRAREADAEERRAHELWEAKGASLLAERARVVGASARSIAAPAIESVTATPAPTRRVRPNAATAMLAEFDIAVAARDLSALRAQFTDDYRELDHPTGSTFGPEEAIASMRRLFDSQDPHYEEDPLATLGESLVLVRRVWGARGAVSKKFDVGEYDNEVLHVMEVDERGRLTRSQVFASGRMLDAVTCLYERYAESLPEGPARTRAQTVARSVAAWMGPIELDELSATIAPSATLADHRVLATWASNTGPELVNQMRAQIELAPDFGPNIDEIRGLESDVLLFRMTFSGHSLDSGGYFGTELLIIYVFRADGRVSHIDAYEAEDDVEALACFEMLTGAAGEDGVSRRRVRPNRASEAMARMGALVAARDFDGLKRLFNDSHTAIEHATGASFGRDGAVASLDRLCRAQDSYFEFMPLATLGDSLALAKRRAGASGTFGGNFDVGAHEIESFNIFEVDSQGLVCRSEIFGEKHLNEAVTRLYERHAELLPAGAAKERAATTARTVAGMGGSSLARFQEAISPTAELVDHRTLGQGTMRGADEIRGWARAMEEVEDFEIHYGDILGLEPNAALIQTMTTGTARTGGGSYERVMWAVWTFANDGLLERLEFFDPTAEAEAIARFDALTSTQPTSHHFANSALRLNERTAALWIESDWQAFGESLSADFRLDDRRRLALVELDKEDFLESMRTFGDMESKRLEFELLATRGDRLALFRETIFVEGGDIGPSETGFLRLVDSDGHDRLLADIRFDDVDLANAYAELDVRFDAGEAAANPTTWASIRRFVHDVAARDWDAVAALCTEELVEYDHRSLAVLGTTHGNVAWARNFSTLVELVPDTIYRVHHFIPADHGYYVHGGWYGSQDGGSYEVPLHAVLELDDRGLIMRADIYDDDVDAALARLAELAGPTASTPTHANAADRFGPMIVAAWDALDWTGLSRLLDVDFRFSDRRKMVQLELDRDGWVEMTRQFGSMSSAQLQIETVATRGERLVLWRAHTELADGDIGPSLVEHLNVFECNEQGTLLVAGIRFDIDDIDAAYAELDARVARIESRGTSNPTANLIRPNAAIRTMDRWLEANETGFVTGDWEAMRALCAPSFVFEDRRRMALLEGDLEMMIASARQRASSGARIRLEHLGTAGDRVAMGRVLWSGGPADGRFEIEYLFLCEVDEESTLIAFVLIDLDSPSALRDEAWARWAAIDPDVPAVIAPISRIAEAFNEQDAEKWRAQFADDLVLDDHRLAGMGRIDGAEAYTQSLVELWKLAPETHADVGWAWPAFDHYGGVTVTRRIGTVPDGGGDFESEYLYLFLVANGRITHVELYELTALAEALVRFKELGADPLLIPPNAATRARERQAASLTAGDWDAMRKLVSPDFVYDDRGRRALVKGDVETWLASMQFSRDLPGIEFDVPLIGTVGDRIAIDHIHWSGSRDTGDFEFERIRVIDVDADGLFQALLFFDPEDRVAAFAEAHARFRAGEATGCRAQAAIDEMLHGYNTRDWALLQRRIADDSVLDDHRPLSFGCIGRDEWIESLRVLFELAPDTRAEFRRTLAWNEHGRVWLGRVYGTRDGGAFENIFVGIEFGDAACIRHREMFAPGDADRAVVRFKELCREPSRDARAALVKSNAASALSDRLLPLFDECANTGNWEPLRAIYASDSTFEDRQRRAMISGDLEMTIGSLRERAAIGARAVSTLLGTFGDRVSVSRLSWTGGPPDGRFEIDYLVLVEVNARGLVVTIILFDADDSRAAQREAWARWAAVDPNVPAVTTPIGQTVDAFNEQDAEKGRAQFVDDLVVVDHRLAGMGRIDGADAYTESLVALWEVAPITRAESGWVWPAFDHYGGVTVVRRTGTVPDGGGDFESDTVFLFTIVGVRIARIELFELTALDQALARFNELGADPLLVPPNAAKHALDRCVRHITAGEWEALRSRVRPDFVFEDRGKRALVEGDIETWIASATFTMSLPGVEVKAPLIGTVGDRVAVTELNWHGSSQGDAFDVRHLRLTEIDANGLLRLVVIFDPEDRAAAFAEAHARFRAGEAAGCPVQAVIDELRHAWATKDWPLMRERLADDIIVDDHRPLSFGRIGREGWIESWRVGVELAPDVSADWYRTLAWNEHGRVWLGRVYGTRDGGEFENVFITVGVADATRVRHYEFFAADDTDRALARFEELCRDRALAPRRVAALPIAFESAVTRTVERATAAEGTRDWEGFAATFAPNFRNEDRRALVQIESDRETWLESYREIIEMTTSQSVCDVLATRGERLALVQMVWHGAEGDVGPSEIEWILVIEVDERGDHTAVVTFDPSDIDTAYAELDARWEAGEAALHPRASKWLAAFQRGFSDREWDAMATLCAPDEVVVNHRLVGWGTLSGQGAWVSTLEALVDLAADTQFRVHHVRTCESGALVRFDWAGTRDGGAYEIPEVLVVELNAQGKQIQMDVWDDDKLDEALARFEELQPDLLRIPPNGATRALKRIHQVRVIGNIESLREVVTDDFCFDDRQRRSLVRGGVEEWLRALEFLWAEARARHRVRAIATSGDRLSLDRVVWTESPGDGAFEMESIRLVEVDESGKLRALLLFDADDLPAAHAELFERYVAMGAEGMPTGGVDFLCGVNERDLVRARGGLCDDIAVDDHRRTGMGLLEGADRYMESVQALHDLMPQGRTAPLYNLRVTPEGRIFVARISGMNSVGGEVESIFLVIQLYRDEKLARMEFFELEHQGDALARFEELVSASADAKEHA